MTLANMQRGQRYFIHQINCEDQALVSKILALGMIPGETIELLHHAPLGDPMQIKAGATYISIRKKDGCFVEVEPLQ